MHLHSVGGDSISHSGLLSQHLHIVVAYRQACIPPPREYSVSSIVGLDETASHTKVITLVLRIRTIASC
jgi:hypothetical protein